jgi:hypothetical protein
LLNLEGPENVNDKIISPLTEVIQERQAASQETSDEFESDQFIESEASQEDLSEEDSKF